MASAMPFLHAIVLIVARLVNLDKTTIDSPKKIAPMSLATASVDATSKLLDRATSTLFFINPADGGMH